MVFNIDAPSLDGQYEIGLIVMTYNRPKYLTRTLRSLRKSDLSDTVLLFVDDVSDDPKTRRLIEQFSHSQAPIVRIWRTEKDGVKMHENLQFAWEWLLANVSCRYLCHLDPDVLVRPHWLQTLRQLHESLRPQTNLMVTGFNAVMHDRLETHADHHIKKSIGGINMFFDVALYQEIVKPVFAKLEWGLDWDWLLCNAMTEKGYPILCTRPSVIQHIGRNGVWAKNHNLNYDFAIDYTFHRRPFTTLTHYAFIARQRSAFWWRSLRNGFSKN